MKEKGKKAYQKPYFELYRRIQWRVLDVFFPYCCSFWASLLPFRMLLVGLLFEGRWRRQWNRSTKK